MIIKASVSLLCITFLIVSTFTFIQVPFISLYPPELHNQTIIYQWQSLTIGTYLSNLQILAVIFLCLSSRTGIALTAIVLYLISGFSGLSIFYYGGGLSYLQQDTVGYLFSFIPAALICGFCLGKPKPGFPPNASRLYFSGVMGLLTIHLIGGFYVAFYYQSVPVVYFFEFVVPQLLWQLGFLVIIAVILAIFYKLAHWQLKSSTPSAQT